MTSEDLELARYIDARLDKTESNLRIYVDEKINEVKIYVDNKIDERFNTLDEKVTKIAETQAVIRREVDTLIGKAEGIQSGFSAMAVIVGFLGIITPAFCFFLTKFLDRPKSENSDSLSPKLLDIISSLIDAKIASLK